MNHLGTRALTNVKYGRWGYARWQKLDSGYIIFGPGVSNSVFND